MSFTKQRLTTARNFAFAIVAAMSLSACANYKDDFATINSRLDGIDAKVQSASQSAQGANESATRANQRLDAMETRIQQLETKPARSPRG